MLFVGYRRNKQCFGRKKLAKEEFSKRRGEQVVTGLGNIRSPANSTHRIQHRLQNLEPV